MKSLSIKVHFVVDMGNELWWKLIAIICSLNIYISLKKDSKESTPDVQIPIQPDSVLDIKHPDKLFK